MPHLGRHVPARWRRTARIAFDTLRSVALRRVLLVVVLVGSVLGGASNASLAAAGYDLGAVDDRLIAATDGCAETCYIWFRLARDTPDAEDAMLMDRRFGAAATPGKEWQTASAGKLLSSVVVMSVVDTGQLSLDDRVEEYFPAYAGTTKGSITLRQLMSHSSGFPGLDVAGFYGHSCMNSASTTLQACAEAILNDVALQYPPGSAFSYGGLSMQIAGAMVERASGKTWNTLWQDNIVGPLGLSPLTRWYSDNPAIHGGAVPNGSKATIEDYDRVLEMLQHGGDFRGTMVLSASSVAAAMDNQVEGLPIVWTPSPDAAGYGIGMWVETEDAAGTTTRVSSPGVFGTRPWIDLERGYRGIMAMMASGPISNTIWGDLQPVIEAQIDSVPADTPPPAPTPFPVVTSAMPGIGTISGGEEVVIRGTGFTGAYAVHFGTDNFSPSFVIDSDTQITAVAPPRGTPSLVNVRVQTPGGVTAMNGAYYRYDPLVVPTITRIEPNTGSATGGQTVTITGTGFTSASRVEFGTGVDAATFTVQSSTRIVATTPERSPSLVNVFVTAPGGRSAPVDWQTWYRFNSPDPSPVVSAVSPSSGSADGGTVVTITGTGFSGATQVEFGTGTRADSFVVSSPTQIVAVSPPRSPALVNVFVTTPAGRSPSVAWQTFFNAQ